MARDFGVLVGAHVNDASISLESSSGLLLLGVIIMSLSIISMVIFACGDDANSSIPRKRKSGGGSMGDGDCGDCPDCVNCGCGPCGGGGACGGGGGGGGGGAGGACGGGCGGGGCC